MKKRKICIALALGMLLSATAFAATKNMPVALTLEEDSALQEQAIVHENLLVLRGDWAKDSQYRPVATVDGELAGRGEVRWTVDDASYKDEFGFTGELTGKDIVSVNEKTGEITAMNSGIVRVTCESAENPEANASVIVVVPGDANKDGVIDEEDVALVVEMATGCMEIPSEDKDDPTTWFLRDLANVSGDTDEIDGDDVDYLVEIVNGIKNI